MYALALKAINGVRRCHRGHHCHTGINRMSPVRPMRRAVESKCAFTGKSNRTGILFVIFVSVMLSVSAYRNLT